MSPEIKILVDIHLKNAIANSPAGHTSNTIYKAYHSAEDLKAFIEKWPPVALKKANYAVYENSDYQNKMPFSDFEKLMNAKPEFNNQETKEKK